MDVLLHDLCVSGVQPSTGVDFSDNFAPVVNDFTFRIIQVIQMMLELDAVLVDIETAFLFMEF